MLFFSDTLYFKGGSSCFIPAAQTVQGDFHRSDLVEMLFMFHKALQI